MGKRMEKLFSILKIFSDSKNICSTKIYKTLYEFCLLFKELKMDTIKNVRVYHIQLYCYLLDSYISKKGITIFDLLDNEMTIIFFLIVIHVIEERFEYSTGLIGINNSSKLLEINDILFENLFQVNNDNSIIHNYWDNILNK